MVTHTHTHTEHNNKKKREMCAGAECGTRYMPVTETEQLTPTRVREVYERERKIVGMEQRKIWRHQDTR